MNEERITNDDILIRIARLHRNSRLAFVEQKWCAPIKKVVSCWNVRGNSIENMLCVYQNVTSNRKCYRKKLDAANENENISPEISKTKK